jgi:adenine-specific DNA methylase
MKDTDSEPELKPLAIEGKLPLKPVGIENLKEANPQYLPPHRYLHPWFARRPTPAARLAILGSVLPEDVDADDLLRLMQFGPKEGVEGDIGTYIENKKATESRRNGTLEEHYAYPRPFSRSPSSKELSELQETLRQHWDGELPTLLDPTAGGGVIPYESLRYGIPTSANELNPVPSLMLRLMLQYAPEVGEIEDEARHWASRVNDRAASKFEDYFPNSDRGDIPCNYISTHVVECKSCGTDIPLVPRWRVRSEANGNLTIVRPERQNDGSYSYEVITSPSDDDLRGFDPSDGPISRGGDAECMNCQVVTESEEIRNRINSGEFEYEVYCVRYWVRNGGYKLRAPEAKDQDALTGASVEVDSNFSLSTFLSAEIPSGNKTSEPRGWGMHQWRDLFSPRQLITNHAYVESIQELKPEIREELNESEYEAVVSILTLTLSKLIDRNSRLGDWDTRQGYPSRTFKGKNFAFKRVFVENNLSIGGIGYESYFEKIYESYRDLVDYLPADAEPASLSTGDAANLPYPDESKDVVLIDPPYYSSIMYSELSDFFYVWMRECLNDVFPDDFDAPLTDKESEAVANTGRFHDVVGARSSSRKLAKDDYENKMSSIFSELYRVLEPGGVMTVMFTHKETDAWDTLTMSLINSGFTITSTHPITSEMPQRAGMRESASADSTLLLTGRKPHTERDTENATPTLWNDVRSDTRAAAKDAARDLIDSGLSLTKTDVIISAFGPTLRVFADAYPVVDDEDNEVPPRRALEEAREAVTQILVDEYLEAEGIGDLDDITEWYILCWLVHESDTFSYDEGLQLGYGIGVDVDDIKRSTKTWRKSRGDMRLRGHADRVQNANEKPENRSSRIPVNPDDLSFGLALDKVHAAMHIYDVKGESACCDWLRERNFGSDSTFKATLQALLQVLPHDYEDWELARDLAVGRTRDVLDLDFSPNVFADDGDETRQSKLGDH